MFLLKFLKNLGSAILDFFAAIVGGIVLAVLTVVFFVKISRLGSRYWNRGVKKPRNPHRGLAIVALAAAFASFALSLLNYHYFLTVKGAPGLISFVCVIINIITMIWLAVVANNQIKKSRALRLS